MSPKTSQGGGTYGQLDFSAAARRNLLRKDQHFARGPKPGEGADPFGEGGFAAGGYGQSGYGAEGGQLEPAQRHEKQASARDYRRDKRK